MTQRQVSLFGVQQQASGCTTWMTWLKNDSQHFASLLCQAVSSCVKLCQAVSSCLLSQRDRNRWPVAHISCICLHRFACVILTLSSKALVHLGKQGPAMRMTTMAKNSRKPIPISVYLLDICWHGLQVLNQGLLRGPSPCQFVQTTYLFALATT